jgi:choline dehydrogenase-like flavoprotein
MFSELKAIPNPWCDVCVVGAGPVGIALALALADSGLNTLLVESGGNRPDKLSRELSTLASYNNDYHHSSEATVVRAIGGTSLRWGGRCVEYDDLDFEPRDHVADAAWPIGHDVLKPFYAAARSMLTADYEDRPAADIADRDLTLSRESWTRTPNAARVHRKRLREHRRLIVIRHATASRLHFDAEGSRLSALTVVGRAMSSQIVAPLFVFAAGGRENTRLLLELQRRFSSLFGGVGGPLGRYYMGHLTGEIATITFSSSSRAERFLFKRAATGSIVRDRFMPTAELQKQHRLLNIAMWPDSLRPDEIIAGNGAVSLFHMARHLIRRARDPIFSHTVAASEATSAHFRNIAAHPVQTVYESSRLLAGRLLSPAYYPQFSFVSPTNSYLLRYHAEHSPLAESRVTLASAKDDNGSHRLDVDFRYAPEDYTSVVRAHDLLADFLSRTNLGTLAFMKPRDMCAEWVAGQALDGYHQIGLTRMSLDRAHGIVDSNCKVHDISNLYIAGSSVFPTSSQANPTLPAVAMALRLASHLAELAQRSPMHAETSASGRNGIALSG